MSSADLTTAAPAIREEFEGTYTEALFYNNQLMGKVLPDGRRVFRVVPNPGDSSFRWKVHSAANSQITTFSEGDSHPQDGVEEYVDAALAYTYAWAVLEISKIAEDALVSSWFDFVEESMELVKQGMTDLFTTTFLNDSAVGLQAAIDDNNTYAGIARGSASYFEAAVNSTGGALSLTLLEALHEEQRSAEHAGKSDIWLMPQNQVSRYAALGTSNDRRDVGSAGGGFDLGYDHMGMRFHGSPVAPMDDLTNTVALGLDVSNGGLRIVDRHPLEVRAIAPSGYNDRLEISRGLAMPVKNPVKCAKIEGLTA